MAETKNRAGGMSAQHKAALAEGRVQGRAVRIYLEALAANRPKRGRKRTTESVKARLHKVNQQIPDASPVQRLQLVQERMDLEAEIATAESPETTDLSELEAAFVDAAKAYSSRKGISYAAWREAGVSAATLKAAGISRSS